MDVDSEIKNLFDRNRRQAHGHQFTVPSARVYPFQWLWDSCFHAIVLSHYDIESAKKEMRAVLSKPLPSGMLPHMIYWNGENETLPNWGREKRGHTINASWQTAGSSSLTQPPVAAQAIYKVYQVDEDKEFLTDVYEALKNHFAYLERDRTFNHDVLAYIINPDESGEDNSPRFDESLGLPDIQTADQSLDRRIHLMQQNAVCNFAAKDCMKDHFGVADVAFNVLYAEELLTFSEIASILDFKADESLFLNRAREIQKEIKKQLRHGEVFLSYDHLRKKHIPTITWNIFMPLYGNLLTQEEANKLVKDYLLNSDYFMTDFGITSTSKKEKSYDPNEGFWRGPIWLAPHWFIYKGLKRYGFKGEAEMIKAKTTKLIEKSGFREQYHPETGDGLGAEDFTWGGLLLDMD